MLKRGLDLALAGLALFLSLPVLFIAAIAIKFDSEGPVFYSQMRMGRGFSRFRIWKLRTMRNDCAGAAYTFSEDCRVTRVGRWLRWSKLDELPQLWNVLRGEMSLVGPRPVVPELITGFEDAYEQLLRVQPGLTDPGTLKYCREDEYLSRIPDRDLYYRTFLVPDKLRLSLAYIDRQSFSGDVAILGQTVLALIPAYRKLHLVQEWFAGKMVSTFALFR